MKPIIRRCSLFLLIERDIIYIINDLIIIWENVSKLACYWRCHSLRHHFFAFEFNVREVDSFLYMQAGAIMWVRRISSSWWTGHPVLDVPTLLLWGISWRGSSDPTLRGWEPAASGWEPCSTATRQGLCVFKLCLILIPDAVWPSRSRMSWSCNCHKPFNTSSSTSPHRISKQAWLCFFKNNIC